MQFLVVATDGTDAEAPMRRQKAREDHLAGLRKLKATGHFIAGGGILNDRDEATGSGLILEFPDRATFDVWLKNDPYMVGNVWQHIDIKTFRPAPI